MFNRSLFYSILTILGLYSCSTKDDTVPETATSGSLQIAFDESYQSIVHQEIDIFKYLYKHATVKATIVAQEKSHELFLKDSVRMIFSSRNLNANESAYLKNRNVFPKVYVFANDGLVVLLNPICSDSVMIISDLKSILSGKNNTKTLVVDNSSGASIQSLTELLTIRPDSLKNIYSAETTQGVIDYVAEHENGIGIISSACISDSDNPNVKKTLKMVRIAKVGWNKNTPAYYPFQSEIADTLYPLVRKIYIISRESKMGLANGFASFLLGEKGQRVVLKSGLLPSRIPSREVVFSKKSVY